MGRWVKATGTIRLDPDAIPLGKTVRTYAPLNNKCMELRKARAPAHNLPCSGLLSCPCMHLLPPLHASVQPDACICTGKG
jgi:hypothetical protein